MAKKLGPKSILIREALAAHPALGNTDLAEMLTNAPGRAKDGITVTAQDVASQKQAMKSPGAVKPAATAEEEWPAPAGELTVAEVAAEPVPEPVAEPPARKKPGRKPGSKNKPRATAPARTTPRPAPPEKVPGNPVDLIERAFALAKDCGGVAELRRLVDAIAGA